MTMLFNSLEPREVWSLTNATVHRAVCEIFQWFREEDRRFDGNIPICSERWLYRAGPVNSFLSMLKDRVHAMTGGKDFSLLQMSTVDVLDEVISVRKQNWRKVRDGLSLCPDGGELGTCYVACGSPRRSMPLLLKIGWTSHNIRKRAGNGDYRHIEDFKMLATRPGTYQMEQELHCRWTRFRVIEKEWYSIEPELVAWVRDEWLLLPEFNKFRQK